MSEAGVNYYMFLSPRISGLYSAVKQPSAEFAIGDTVSDAGGVFVSSRPAWFLTVHEADKFVLARVTILKEMVKTSCAVLVSQFRVEEIVNEEERNSVLTDSVLDPATGEISVFVNGVLSHKEKVFL
jgi:hypothetical protein